jgi:preprotein translocase subunit SecG
MKGVQQLAQSIGPGTNLPPAQQSQSVSNFSGSFSGSGGGSSFFNVLANIGHFLYVFFAFASIFFMLVIIFVVIQRNFVFAYDDSLNKPYPKKAEKEEEHMEIGSESSYRMAIIEADNILYEILRKAGYSGESLGEMLTNASPANFRSLENAWEAHRVRNYVAHEGSNFQLSEREARRIVSLYKSVFREFGYL